jgi:hypothetical protein
MSDDFIDTIGTPEFFCETLAKVEQAGGASCTRLIMIVNRGGYKIPVATLVLPTEALMPMIEMLRGALLPPAERSTLLSMPAGIAAH